MLLLLFISCVENNKEDNYFIVEIISGNLENDKEILNGVSGAVYSYLAALLSDSASVMETQSLIENNLIHINYIINQTLEKQNLILNTKVKITTKSISGQCGNIVIKRGNYKTLEIIIGEGGGIRKWCLAYPNLSYVEGENEIILKSKILDTIKEKKSNGKK